MFSSPDVRKSVDSLASPPPGITHRADFPFHKQHPRQRRESNASSITVTSIGGSLDTAFGVSWPDAVHESDQNAISTLLQPPIVRTGLLPHTAAPAHSAHKPPTAKDIPPVPLTNIPHVEISEFHAYLAQVGALHEQLRRVQESEDEQQQQQQPATGVMSPSRRNSSKEDLSTVTDDGLLRPGTKRTSSTLRKLSMSSVSSLSLADTQSPVRKSSSGILSRRANQGPPPLSTIPSVYFDEDFHLENPRTFDIVSERSEVVPSSTTTGSEKARSNDGTEAVAPAPRKALATNAILQEKLSWYMDTVEMHLIASISTASTAFFTALGSLKELHTEAADSVNRIKALRTELGALDEEIAIRGLTIVQKQRDRQNLQQLHAAVMQLRDIVDDVGACEKLVDEGEIDKALDSIACLERLIAGEMDTARASQKEKTQKQGQRWQRTYALQDLRGATALQGVQDDIATLRLRIGKAYEAKFVAALLQDLRRHIETVPRREVLMRWNSAAMRARGGHSREPSAFPAYLASTDALRLELLPMVAGLYRARHIAAATQVYRESVMREIRNLIRRPLPSSNDEDNESMMSSSTLGSGRRTSQQEKSIVLARNLRALEPEDAEELLMTIYISVTEALRRMTTQAKVLLDVASFVGLDSDETSELMSPPFSPSGRPMQQPLSTAGIEAQGELHKTLDLGNFTGQAVDVAQEKMVRILRVRSEQSARLSLVLFLRYFTLNLHFANECEAISGRSGTALKTAVNGQIKTFVQNNGNSEAQQLAQEMESDQWTAKDFADEDNALLQEILQASTKDAEAWTADIQLWAPSKPADDGDGGDRTGSTAAGGGGKAKTRSAIIDEETFLVPTSALLCLQGIGRFMRLTVAIPFMTTDVASSLVQYLQLFNSRCAQLILGAGATRTTAGLKNITTRHLAIASQALAFLAALVPYMREFIRRRMASAPGGGSGTTGSVSGLMGEFDRVRRLYQEHQNNIYDKLVEIMGGRAAVHARAMQAIDWDGDTDGTVHAYMEALAKETTTLHRNLAKTLPEGTVLFIMAPVFSGYAETLGGVLRAAEATTQNGKDSMLRDIDFFEARLSKIDGFGKSGRDLRAIVEDKVIRPPTPPPPPSPPPPTEPEPNPEPEPEPEPALAPAEPAAEELKDKKEVEDEGIVEEAKDEDEDEDVKNGGTKDDGVKDEEAKDDEAKDEEAKDEDAKDEDEDVKDIATNDDGAKDEDSKDEDSKDEDAKDRDTKGKDVEHKETEDKDTKDEDAKDREVGDRENDENEEKNESTLPPAPPPKDVDSNASASTSKSKGRKSGGRRKRAGSSAQSKKR